MADRTDFLPSQGGAEGRQQVDPQDEFSGLEDLLTPQDSGDGLPPLPGDDSQGAIAPEAMTPDQVEQLVERALQRQRHDLEEQLERRVQSFSDRTAARLRQEQQERLQQVDAILESLREDMRPEDFERARTRARLDALAALAGEPGHAPQSPQDFSQQSQQQPPQQQSQPVANDAAVGYLDTRLGSPDTLSPQEAAYLRGAPDWRTWYARVDEVAQRRGTQNSRTPSQQGNPALAQPQGGGRRPAGAMSYEQLQAALNRAYEVGDDAEITRLGQIVDRMVARQG